MFHEVIFSPHSINQRTSLEGNHTLNETLKLPLLKARDLEPEIVFHTVYVRMRYFFFSASEGEYDGLVFVLLIEQFGISAFVSSFLLEMP